MKAVGVIRFLGTNCDTDVFEAVEAVGLPAKWVWFEDQFNDGEYSALILPGGFSYGDYLRSGALAAKMPVMKSVRQAANKGVPVMGICNGFQILCEAELLPGALVRNRDRRFIDKWVTLKKQNASPFFGGEAAVRLPVAHGDGCYYAPKDVLKELQDNSQVWWTYEEDINGSVEQIAGVMNKTKNVAGLMPHPERAMAPHLGGEAGRGFFESLLR